MSSHSELFLCESHTTNSPSLLVATHPLFHVDIVDDADGLLPPITVVIIMVEVVFHGLM